MSPLSSPADTKRRRRAGAGARGRMPATLVMAGATAFLCTAMFVLGMNFRAHEVHVHAAATQTITFTSDAAAAGRRSSETAPAAEAHDPVAERWRALAEDVRNATAYAFNSYMRDARGMDEYLPVSRSGINTFGGMGLSASRAAPPPATTAWGPPELTPLPLLQRSSTRSTPSS